MIIEIIKMYANNISILASTSKIDLEDIQASGLGVVTLNSISLGKYEIKSIKFIGIIYFSRIKLL